MRTRKVGWTHIAEILIYGNCKPLAEFFCGNAF